MYRGSLSDGTPVAIKAVRFQINTSEDDQKPLKVGVFQLLCADVTERVTARGSGAPHMVEMPAPQCDRAARVGGVPGTNRNGVALDGQREPVVIP